MIDIDELYNKKKKKKELQIEKYKNILNRVHSRIRSADDEFCWFVMPEFIIGEPTFNNRECTEYVLKKLSENGFVVRYTAPNLIFISWSHHVPKYMRPKKVSVYDNAALVSLSKSLS